MDDGMEGIFLVIGGVIGFIIGLVILNLLFVFGTGNPYELVEDDFKFYEIREVTETDFRLLQIIQLEKEDK